MAIDANRMSSLDASQVTRSTVVELSDGLAQRVSVITGQLVPKEYDQITLTYVTAGNGIGEIETVIYKLQTNTIATLTLSYDVSNKLIDVLRS